MRSPDRIAVTGMGCFCAAGETLAAAIDSIDKGERNFSPTPFTGVAPGSPVFSCSGALPGAHTLSRTARIALAAVDEALAQASLPGNALGDASGDASGNALGGTPCSAPGLRVAVCIGTSVGVSLHFREYYAAWKKGEPHAFDSITTYRESNPSLAIARIYGFAGPAQSIANACSSGADAIGLAASWLKAGLCDVAVAGGADALSEVTYTGFSRLMLASPEPCRPFDVSRSGLNLGEGAGIMVLERQRCAQKRGAAILGYMDGYGTATDCYHLTSPHPEAAGLKKAYAQAFGDTEDFAASIAFVNAHGTGTKTNDAVEGKFFAEFLPGVPFVATKGATGHTLGAAGGVEAVLTLAHLRRGFLPASPGFAAPDPGTVASPLASPAPFSEKIAASQSLAFGGNNSVLVFSVEGA